MSRRLTTERQARSFVPLRLDPRHPEFEPTCGSDVEHLGRFCDGAALIRRFHCSQVLAALADVIDAPAGHRSYLSLGGGIAISFQLGRTSTFPPHLSHTMRGANDG